MHGTCDSPPDIDNANYEPLDYYPEGTEVYYYCENGYNREVGDNLKLTCTSSDQSRAEWKGEQVQCNSSIALSKILLIYLVNSHLSRCDNELRFML